MYTCIYIQELTSPLKRISCHSRCIRDTTQSFMWCGSFMCDMTHCANNYEHTHTHAALMHTHVCTHSYIFILLLLLLLRWVLWWERTKRTQLVVISYIILINILTPPPGQPARFACHRKRVVTHISSKIITPFRPSLDPNAHSRCTRHSQGVVTLIPTRCPWPWHTQRVIVCAGLSLPPPSCPQRGVGWVSRVEIANVLFWDLVWMFRRQHAVAATCKPLYHVVAVVLVCVCSVRHCWRRCVGERWRAVAIALTFNCRGAWPPL